MSALLDYIPRVDDAAREITATLAARGIAARATDPIAGPSTLTYPLLLDAAARPEDVDKAARSLALRLQVDAVRVTTSAAGIAVEVPRTDRQPVPQQSLPADAPPLAWPVGVDTRGEVVTADLASAPHVLIAGTTGAGKSTAVHALLSTIVGRTTPADVRLLLVDVKRVELATYGRTPHAVGPVATTVDDAAEALRWAVDDMETRYALLEQRGARSIADLPAGTMPRLVIVVDELADLMLQARKVCEPLLVRLTQLGRAAGVHLVLATQRPSADVLTGLIRANVPARLALTVQSHVDSGIALGMSGAETLTGRGDALWLPSGARQPVRVQVPLADAPALPIHDAPIVDAPIAASLPAPVAVTEAPPVVLCCLCQRHPAVFGTSVCIADDCEVPTFGLSPQQLAAVHAGDPLSPPPAPRSRRGLFGRRRRGES